MQVEIYEPTRRDKLRAAAVSDTPAGRMSHRQTVDNLRAVNEYRRKHGLQPFPMPSEKEDTPS